MVFNFMHYPLQNVRYVPQCNHSACDKRECHLDKISSVRSGPTTILKSKFQTDVTFDVIYIINQNFNIVFESSYCSHRQIVKILSQVKIEIFRIQFKT